MRFRSMSVSSATIQTLRSLQRSTVVLAIVTSASFSLDDVYFITLHITWQHANKPLFVSWVIQELNLWWLKEHFFRKLDLSSFAPLAATNLSCLFRGRLAVSIENNWNTWVVCLYMIYVRVKHMLEQITFLKRNSLNQGLSIQYVSCVFRYVTTGVLKFP